MNFGMYLSVFLDLLDMRKVNRQKNLIKILTPTNITDC